MPAVHKFFELYKQILADNNLPPSRIFNCDDAGMSTVHKPSKVLGSKGKHQIGALTSAERGRNVTVACCMSATGQFVPPAFLFPRKRMKAELMDAAPTESIAFCEGSGWMNGHIFRQYLEHVRKRISASLMNKILLVLDGHSSHTKNIDVLPLFTSSARRKSSRMIRWRGALHQKQLARCHFGALDFNPSTRFRRQPTTQSKQRHWMLLKFSRQYNYRRQ